MINSRLKQSVTPIQIRSSYTKRANSILWDSSIISFLASSTMIPVINMHEFLIGHYTGLLTLQHMSAIILSFIPIYYLISMAYYYCFYNKPLAKTPTNSHYKNCVVPISFVFNENNRDFMLSQSQILRRSFAMTITTIGFFLPNLIALADPNSRGFADYLSDTMTISEDEFYQLFTTKVSTEYQVFIDIDGLNIKPEEQVDEFSIAA